MYICTCNNVTNDKYMEKELKIKTVVDLPATFSSLGTEDYVSVPLTLSSESKTRKAATDYMKKHEGVRLKVKIWNTDLKATVTRIS